MAYRSRFDPVGAWRAVPACVIPAKVVDPALTGGNPDSNLPNKKPLDTARKKGILIEDIVVDNPWEGSIDVAIAGVRTC